MSKRHFDRFPAEFQRVTDAALARIAATSPGGAPLLSFSCPSVGQAINLQMQLRQYWMALEEQARSGKIPQYDPEYPRAQGATMLACRSKKGDKKVVEVVHRSQLATAKIMAEVLGSIDAALAAVAPATPDPRVLEVLRESSSSAQDQLLETLYAPTPPKPKA